MNKKQKRLDFEVVINPIRLEENSDQINSSHFIRFLFKV